MITTNTLAGAADREIRLHRRFRVTVAVSLLVIVLVIAFGFVVRQPWWSRVEVSILNDLVANRVPVMTVLALVINIVFGTIGGAIIVLVIAGVMAVDSRGPRMPLTFLALAVVPWLGQEVIKQIVRRPRPESLVITHHALIPTPVSFSYPSGHTTFVTCLFLALLLTVGARGAKPLFVVLAIVLPLATAFSRMYLGVHYLTDVLAAIVYSLAAVTLVYAVILRYFPIRVSEATPASEPMQANRPTQASSPT